MRDFTQEEKRKAHLTLQTDEFALDQYQEELKAALKNGIREACRRSVYVSTINSFKDTMPPSHQAIERSQQERESLEKDMDKWAEGMAAEVKTIIELAIGRGIEEPEPVEKLKRVNILDLRRD